MTRNVPMVLLIEEDASIADPLIFGLRREESCMRATAFRAKSWP